MKRPFYKLMLLTVLLVNAPAGATPPKNIDSLDQRLAACMACHGADGRAGPDGYLPRIAGKPEGYLYQQLLNFREGRRVNPAMQRMVERLPDAYLKEIATYFAAQDLPYPAPANIALTATQLAQGRRMVTEGDAARKLPACVACHGQRLSGVSPSIPSLLGLPRDYITQQLSAWRQGSRRAASPDCMAHMANGLTPSDIVAVSAWLSTQAIPANYKPAATLPAALPLTCGGVQ